ncbi:MAG: Rieske (2Fe-2S) iron-sulfur domain protein [Bacillales bacterium]|nr:Rieske (2Fe-2S) iron-sulfur domain protein [Bacillales bacterium]
MDRLEFLTEMKKGILNTIKEVSKPFLEEEAEKVNKLTDEISGIHWAPTGLSVETIKENKVVELIILRQQILLADLNDQIVCYKKICKNCNSIVNYISYRKVIKCLMCEEEINVQTWEGTVQLDSFKTKVENDKLYVAIPLELFKKKEV